MNATYANKADVPQSALDEEKEVLMTQIANDEKNKNKPAQIIEKMVAGKLGKFYENYCLAEQLYVKDDSMTVQKYIDSVAKELSAARSPSTASSATRRARDSRSVRTISLRKSRR